jgi:hypothetical protein
MNLRTEDKATTYKLNIPFILISKIFFLDDNQVKPSTDKHFKKKLPTVYRQLL